MAGQMCIAVRRSLLRSFQPSPVACASVTLRVRQYPCLEGKKGYRVVPMERLRNTFGVRVHVDDGMSETSHDDIGEGRCGGIEEGGAAGSDGRGYAPRDFHDDPPASFAEPPLELVDDTPVPLGPGSYVRDLRRRLQELGGNTSGSKAVMWARLQKIEKHNKDEARLRNALRERQEDMIAGVAPHEIRGVVKPEAPSEMERKLHELTHTPAAEWCEFCIMGQGSEKRHTR
eukprot:1022324-Amphidinium_carterae.1